MVRFALFASVMAGLAACAAERTPRYVVRLDLDRVATQTSARDRGPGFALLGR
jgi:hypothetical protein